MLSHLWNFRNIIRMIQHQHGKRIRIGSTRTIGSGSEHSVGIVLCVNGSSLSKNRLILIEWQEPIGNLFKERMVRQLVKLPQENIHALFHHFLGIDILSHLYINSLAVIRHTDIICLIIILVADAIISQQILQIIISMLSNAVLQGTYHSIGNTISETICIFLRQHFTLKGHGKLLLNLKNQLWKFYFQLFTVLLFANSLWHAG